MFTIWDSRHEGLQLFWLSFKYCNLSRRYVFDLSPAKLCPFYWTLNLLTACLQLWKELQLMLGTSMTHLTHWGRVTHKCVSELTIIGLDNGLSPGRRQAIIWNNPGLLLIEPLWTNVSEISIGIQTFSLTKMHLNMSSAKWRPFCIGLNVLTHCRLMTPYGDITIWVNIGSGNGLLLDGAKPSPEPLLTYSLKIADVNVFVIQVRWKITACHLKTRWAYTRH